MKSLQILLLFLSLTARFTMSGRNLEAACLQLHSDFSQDVSLFGMIGLIWVSHAKDSACDHWPKVRSAEERPVRHLKIFHQRRHRARHITSHHNFPLRFGEF